MRKSLKRGQDLSERYQRHRSELLCCASLPLGLVLSSFVSRSLCLAEISLLGFLFSLIVGDFERKPG